MTGGFAAGSVSGRGPSRGAVVAGLPLAQVPARLDGCAAWGRTCPRRSSSRCCVMRTRCCAGRCAVGRNGIASTGSGWRRCPSWFTAAGGLKSSRSPRPRSCAGTVTWSPGSGRTPTGVGRVGRRPRFDQDADCSRGAGKPDLSKGVGMRQQNRHDNTISWPSIANDSPRYVTSRGPSTPDSTSPPTVPGLSCNTATGCEGIRTCRCRSPARAMPDAVATAGPELEPPAISEGREDWRSRFTRGDPEQGRRRPASMRFRASVIGLDEVGVHGRTQPCRVGR